MRYYLFVVLLCILSSIQAQSEAIIEFSYTDILIKYGVVLSLNGTQIDPTLSSQKVPVHDDKFDTISYVRENTHHGYILLKLKKGETYILKGNPCAGLGYELMAKDNPKMGLVRFSMTQGDSLFGDVDGFRRMMTPEKPTEYLRPQLSAMCYFDDKHFSICTSNYSDWDDPGRKKCTTSLDFHFLHGELVLAEYDPDENKINLTIEKYMSKEENFGDYFDENE